MWTPEDELALLASTVVYYKTFPKKRKRRWLLIPVIIAAVLVAVLVLLTRRMRTAEQLVVPESLVAYLRSTTAPNGTLTLPAAVKERMAGNCLAIDDYSLASTDTMSQCGQSHRMPTYPGYKPSQRIIDILVSR